MREHRCRLLSFRRWKQSCSLKRKQRNEINEEIVDGLIVLHIKEGHCQCLSNPLRCFLSPLHGFQNSVKAFSFGREGVILYP